MKDDKKNVASIIISKMRKPEPMEESSEHEMPESDEYDYAAEEVMQAIEAKDKDALKEALKSFVDMCMNSEPSESEESES